MDVVEIIFGLVVVGGVLLAFIMYLRSQAGSSTPVPIQADDVEMIAARQKAQATIVEFQRLYGEENEAVLAKVPVTSSAGVLEWMVGDVLELTDVYVKIQFNGRPVTHRGTFQEIQTFPIRDIADWHVTLPNGKYRGGFTQRVHFDRMRARGTLVGEAALQAAKYE